MASQELHGFELIDHTADAGIKAYGSSLEELYENAALGLFSLIADLRNVRPVTARHIELEAGDREELLVRWLSELNYLFFTKSELYSRFEIESLSATHLQGQAFGERIDESRHVVHTEVKAVTYHHLYVDKTGRGWQAQVIFDL